ncbi:hypothetical protein E8E13_007898 [Curvularia kusanoi]|uniref:Uncharacterized protein n=1 Tax=Curvularia kusanoi TaxID=90978 RepID=A0A9P4TBV4_CURKU|nr:hypothetical protein E8E13_007898 [Curvularia kusanoi]
MAATQPVLQQPSDTAPGCTRTEMVQHTMQQLQGQISELIAKNKELKSKIKSQRKLESKLHWLEWTDTEHRKITYRLSLVARKYNDTLPLEDIPTFRISGWNSEDGLTLSDKTRRLASHSRECSWISWAEEELDSAQEAQASIDTANAENEEMKRRNQELEQQIYDKEQSEKHCHQVIDHLQTLMEAYPGAAIGKVKAKRSCEEMNVTAVESTIEWLSQAKEQLRFAQEVQKTVERSNKRRKTKL